MRYIHVVCFTLKPGTPDDRLRAQIADADALLAGIPTVRMVRSGPRDQTMQRPVSVTDFDIGLVVVFDDKAGYEVYADHPLHLEYVQRHRDGWSRVAVIDFQA